MNSAILKTAFMLIGASTANFAQAADQQDANAAVVDGGVSNSQLDVNSKAAKKAAAEDKKRKKQLEKQYGLGPYPDEIEQFIASRPEKLKPFFKTLLVGGERNAVLNFNRLGLAAIQEGSWTDAEWAFDRSLAQIETVYADNPQAKTARSIFHNEANKDFKGEPYERSMAYYYRGLLYLRAGDYDNARASFKGAEFQDTLSEVESFQSDFAVMNYLIGWTQHCQGQESSAQESFATAGKAQEGLKAPDPKDNVLFIAEFGNGPVKSRSGSNEEMLIFERGPAYRENAVDFVVSKAKGEPAKIPGQIASSVFTQASTRGGRGIDGILKGKAQAKDLASGAGDALMLGGLLQGGNTGASMSGFGLALSLFSSSMKTKADIRGWDGLPDLITVGTAQIDKPGWNHSVVFRDTDGPVELAGPTMRGTHQKCTVIWSGTKNWSDLPPTVAGEDQGVADAIRKKKSVQEKDLAFRRSLAS